MTRRPRQPLPLGAWAEPGRELDARIAEATSEAGHTDPCGLCRALRNPFTWAAGALLWALIGVAIWRGAGAVLLAGGVLVPLLIAGFWPNKERS